MIMILFHFAHLKLIYTFIHNERFKSKKSIKIALTSQLLKQNKSYYERPNSVVLAYISHLDLARFFSMKRHVVYTRKKVS